MISIAIPPSLIPDNYKHTVPEPYYRNGDFQGVRDNILVPLNNELVLTVAYGDDTFFTEMSGNEFVKLIERDELPSWATPELLFNHSTAKGILNPLTRKIKWIRPKKKCLNS